MIENIAVGFAILGLALEFIGVLGLLATLAYEMITNNSDFDWATRFIFAAIGGLGLVVIGFVIHLIGLGING